MAWNLNSKLKLCRAISRTCSASLESFQKCIIKMILINFRWLAHHGKNL